MRSLPLTLLFLFLCLALGTRALASDGVLEINQTCAVETGCFAGDAAGFPVTITQPGSHVLTGNLRVTGGDGTAIQIDSSLVALDLKGFTITGGAGSGNGIEASVLISDPFVVRQIGITVRNGAVQSFGEACLLLGQNARVEDMFATGCMNGGIEVGPGSLVLRNIIVGNQGQKAGLEADDSTGYADNQILANAIDVNGGRALGVNICTGGRACARFPPLRRYYLTSDPFNGDQADEPGTCAPGFHFASLWEIHDLSNLQYETSLGLPSDDAGSGPPSWLSSALGGWVRTGFESSSASTPGEANCDTWTSGSTGAGSVAFLSPAWADGNLNGLLPIGPVTPPWGTSIAPCSFPTIHVWCVED